MGEGYAHNRSFCRGKDISGTSGRTADVYQPYDARIQTRVALASAAEVRAAVENAKAAQPAWAAINPQRRARVLRKFLELIEAETEPLAELIAREHGKTLADGQGRYPAWT